MRRPFEESREIGGADPIDVGIVARRQPLRALLSGLLRRRGALGLAPAIAPAVVFVPLGVVLGPAFLGLLSRNVLVHLDVVVSVGLAALGVFVGTALKLPSARDRALLVAGCIESFITIGFVAAALWFLLVQWGMPLLLPPALVALTLGICAAASSAGSVESSSDEKHRTATRIADLDDALPILIGGVAIALVASTGAAPVKDALMSAGRTALAGLAIAVAGWLLFERAHSNTERGVFIVGTLVLLGGSAASLSGSPLLAGMAAGLFWTWMPGRAEQMVRESLRKFQHPLIVLMLLVAGASCRLTMAAIWLFAPLVLFRLAGKLAGGWVAARLREEVTPGDLGTYLIAPGLLGIAFALNVHQMGGAVGGTDIITATSAAALASEALAIVLVPTKSERPDAPIRTETTPA
ncbi:MAG: hypothetical protein GEV06_02100 [Luteitalea sp.]|nr:hypothetical protein [Luteitalea sp.]